jgi:hypothetical protein
MNDRHRRRRRWSYAVIAALPANFSIRACVVIKTGTAGNDMASSPQFGPEHFRARHVVE